MSGSKAESQTPSSDDELDRHRRRVLWALPTGLYVVGSRDGDEANLMTANLVVQVCVEPKLVAVAIEASAVTLRLVNGAKAFSISMLDRSDRDVVRRFVKPVTAAGVERAPDGSILTMSGHPVTEIGTDRLPVLAAAAGYLACAVTRVEPLGSHTLCIGKVTDFGGEPSNVLRMEDTRMHYGG
jgi:flavin reductase (DIM6/NTAB) family NADH-FMN oxidoreductase RutF